MTSLANLSTSPQIHWYRFEVRLNLSLDVPRPPNKAVTAAREFLRSADPKSLLRLTALCVRACRGLFLPDAYGRQEYGRKQLEDFCLAWALTEIRKFEDCNEAELAERADELRFIPRRCRLALLDKLRGCPTCRRRKVKQEGKLVCERGCAAPRIDSLDSNHIEFLPLSEVIAAPVGPVRADLKHWIRVNETRLRRENLFDGLILLDLALREDLDMDELSQLWSRVQKISLRTAREQRAAFFARLQESSIGAELRGLLRDAIESNEGSHPTIALR